MINPDAYAFVQTLLKDSGGKMNNSEIHKLASEAGHHLSKDTVRKIRKAEGYKPRPQGGAGHTRKPRTMRMPATAAGSIDAMVRALREMGVIEFHLTDHKVVVIRKQTLEIK